MVVLFAALLAVILCGTISASERVAEERKVSLPFFGDERRLRGFFAGIAKTGERVSRVDVKGTLLNLMKAKKNLDKGKLGGTVHHKYLKKLKGLREKVADNPLLFVCLPGLLGDKKEPTLIATKVIGEFFHHNFCGGGCKSDDNCMSYKIITRALQNLKIGDDSEVAKIKEEDEEVWYNRYESVKKSRPAVINFIEFIEKEIRKSGGEDPMKVDIRQIKSYLERCKCKLERVLITSIYVISQFPHDLPKAFTFVEKLKVQSDKNISLEGNTVALQKDGKIVVAGTSGNNFAVARYNTDGSFDLMSGTGRKVTTDFGRDDIKIGDEDSEGIFPILGAFIGAAKYHGSVASEEQSLSFSTLDDEELSNLAGVEY